MNVYKSNDITESDSSNEEYESIFERIKKVKSKEMWLVRAYIMIIAILVTPTLMLNIMVFAMSCFDCSPYLNYQQ